jgi:D-tyrosyl-tRNA(Tyr) deacylase
MLALLQRVKEARVEIAREVVGAIDQGLLVLVCAEPEDTEATGDKLLDKILKLRIFSDEAGKMNLNVVDAGGSLLIVSQFTLAADCNKGNRPSFNKAAPAEQGERLYNYFVQQARKVHPVVHTGQFGADMQVHLINDGPVTVPLRIALND